LDLEKDNEINLNRKFIKVCFVIFLIDEVVVKFNLKLNIINLLNVINELLFLNC